MKYPEVSKRLKIALHDAGMTQQELSDKTGISKASISQYANGTHCPSNISAGKIGAVLDVNPVWLMDLSPNKKEVKNPDDASLDVDMIMDKEFREKMKKVYEMNDQKKQMIYSYIDFISNS